MTATANARSSNRRKRSIDRATVDNAHRAIVEGNKSLGEISAMVKEVANGGRFSGLDLDADLPPIDLPARRIPIRKQMIFGVRFSSAMSLSCALGFVAGVPIGFALNGTAMQAAIVTLLPFLG